MMELLGQPHVEARLVGSDQIDLLLRRGVSLVDVGAGEVRLLRGRGARGVAAGAEPGQQRIDRGLETRVTGGGIGRELLAATGRLHRRRGQLHAGGGRGAGADPCLDPHQHGGRARGRVRDPAVVAAAHLQDQRRLVQSREVHQRAGSLVGEGHVVRAREHRGLPALVVTAATAVGGADVFPQIDLERLHVGIRRRRPGIRVRRAAGRGRLLVHGGRGAPAAAGSQGGEHQEGAGAERARDSQGGNRAVHGGAPLLARTGGSGQLEHLLESVAAGLEAGLDGRDGRLIRGAVGRPKAHRLEHLGHLAVREGIARGEFLAQGLGARAASRQGRVPTEGGVGARAPAVRPAVVGCHEAEREVGGVDQVLRLHLAGRVLERAGIGAVADDGAHEVVVRERLRHGIHATVATDAVVEEYAAVPARRARHILADPIRGPRGVHHRLHVVAEVIDHGEAEHRAVGAVDEERGSRAARGDEAGGRLRRYAVGGRLRGALERGAQINAVALRAGVVIVVQGRRRRQSGRVHDVENVVGERGVERHVVAGHADDGRGVVIERREHALVAIGPRDHQVLQRHVVERRGAGGDAGGSQQARLPGTGADRGRHLAEHTRRRRLAGDALVDALGLLVRSGVGGNAQLRQQQHGRRQRASRAGRHDLCLVQSDIHSARQLPKLSEARCGLYVARPPHRMSQPADVADRRHSPSLLVRVDHCAGNCEPGHGVPAIVRLPRSAIGPAYCGPYENREAQRRAVMGSAFMATLMAISTQNDLELRYIHGRRRVRVAGEAHMHAQRGRQNLMRCTRRAIALLTAALATGLAACSGGGSVNIANSQVADPATVDFPIFYVKRRVPLSSTGTVLQDDLRVLRDAVPPADLYERASASPSATETNITARLAAGASWDVKDVDASADGTRVVFAMRGPLAMNQDPKKPPSWRIYEYVIASNTLHAVINPASDPDPLSVNDVSPHYLPDGRIVFSTTRQTQSQGILLDEGKPQFAAQDEDPTEPAFVLQVMNADGTGVHQISFNQSHDRDATVLANGRVLGSRWDHAPGKDAMHLYSANPDGTDLELYYGANSHMTGTNNTVVEFVQARQMQDGRILALMRQYTGVDFGGNLVIIDGTHFAENTQPLAANAALTGPAQTPGTPNDVRTIPGPSPGGRFDTGYPLQDGTNRILCS